MSEFTAALVPAVGQALIQFTWQGALIGALAAIALRIAREARPQVRYAIACIAMLACVVVPVASVLLAFGDAQTGAFIAARAPIRFIEASNDAVVALDWRTRLETMSPLIVALWATGASVFCLRTLFGVAWVARMRATTQSPLQAQWQARLDALAERFGLRGVALRLVDALDSPVAAGWLRPVVLLPTSVALRMPVELVDALLAHELAHVRRHDYLVNLLQRAVEALLFYHPVTWWLSRRVRIERELIADRLAADAIGDPRRLAVALAALSELPVRPALPHLAHAAHGGQLMSRIQQLIRSQSRAQRTPPAGRVALPLIGIAAACVAFYAQAQIGHAPNIATPAVTARPVVASAPSAMATPVVAASPAVKATPVVAATPAVQATPVVAQVTHFGNDKDRDAWAIVRKGEDGYSMSGSAGDMHDIDAAKRALQDDFVWYRHAGKAYVIDDPAIVARARAAWKNTDALGKQMSALGDQMSVHGNKMEALGKQMEALSKDNTPSAAMMQASERMSALGKQQSELAGRQQLIAMKQRKADSDAENAKLDAEMDKLGEEMDKLGEQMDAQGAIVDRESAKLDRNSEPMDALGRQMDEASKPMDELGKQMDALGKQQEIEARKAEKTLRALIGEAESKGLAKPAPGRSSAQ
ncbi:hypothetical protein LVB87_14035 [Lysobacter sp. KIS68-7]|uniref:M56 family metallopeptidase n=1 Tax=Lysobacter sp. KIS68-7 TaxID=2904252 RepID=UPI001E37786E|nr:M56 family metallopeptidase [Lysobacter sp. KIS68-7]UHQ19287.1 hypothetical protein LVB87_14035 [Lysobacter sp. KIS68-7]